MAYDGTWTHLNIAMVESMKLTSEGNLPAPTFDLESWAGNYEGEHPALSQQQPG